MGTVRRPFLVWHPSVHAWFRDELVFYFLTVSAFPKDAFYESLEKLLIETGHTSYRIYRIFGTFDVILRVWIAKGHAHEFARTLSTKLEYITQAVPAIVEEIPHHWRYRDSTPHESILHLTPDEVRPIQEMFSRPERWTQEPVHSAMQNFLVRPIEDADGTIMFFTGITHSSARSLHIPTLLGEIFGLFEISAALNKTVVYRTTETYALLIKCETTEFFNVGAFIRELSHRIAVNRCSTVTSVVADPVIRGREEIGKRSFKQVEQRHIPTFNILPELYDNETMSLRDRARIEAWIRDELVPSRARLTGEEVNGIRKCLLAVIKDDEKEFLGGIMELYGPIERELRKLQGPFIAKVNGSDSIRATIEAALRHTGDARAKSLDKLSLGDRLDVYVHVIKKKGLSIDEDVIGSWNRETQLRDSAAHFSEKCFGHWDHELPIAVSFLRRYKELLRIVKARI